MMAIIPEYNLPGTDCAQSIMRRAISREEHRWFYGHRPSLEELPRLLEETRHNQCSDSRDRVYALLGPLEPVYFVGEGGIGRLDADYSISPAQVAERIMLAVELKDYERLPFEKLLYGELGWDQEWARKVPDRI
jgi:hypothetical protein